MRWSSTRPTSKGAAGAWTTRRRCWATAASCCAAGSTGWSRSKASGCRCPSSSSACNRTRGSSAPARWRCRRRAASAPSSSPPRQARQRWKNTARARSASNCAGTSPRCSIARCCRGAFASSPRCRSTSAARSRHKRCSTCSRAARHDAAAGARRYPQRRPRQFPPARAGGARAFRRPLSGVSHPARHRAARLGGAPRAAPFRGPRRKLRHRQLQVPGAGAPGGRADPGAAPRCRRPALQVPRAGARLLERQGPVRRAAMMSACAVIPCFNHGATAGAVAARVRAHGLPVLIVDDGSDADSARALDAIEGVRVLRLEKNGGKGAAVMRGLREAQRLGYTHALQIDADGQHATDDVPRFVENGRARDDAVVCGDPVFDASAPKSRRYGRWITRFWVWLETRGRARGDALCGFRLYPLARAVALLDRARIATGMSFDVDILVRLVWEGLPVESVQTRVVYPPGGRSHFRLLRDNLRISATHTRLFFASFAPRSAAAHWSRLSERGALWGLRFLVAAYRLGGRPLFRAFLYPVMLYFFLFGSVARRASRDFLRRAHRAGSPRLPSPPTWRDSFRHFLAFADATLDKVGAWLHRVPSPALA